MRRALLALGGLAGLGTAQQAGKYEDGPQVIVHWCAEDGDCQAEEGAFTIDASWRVQRNASEGGWQSCIIQDGMWDSRLCPDPLTCAKRCAVDGMDLDEYSNVHGITELEAGIRLNYVTATQYGLNVGSRLYMLDEDYKDYKIFHLKNREFSFDIDVSTLPCGVNAALYLIAMDKTGGRGKGNNDAGAKYGTGYCDAHCPHSSNFVDGEANMDWQYGSCCTEIDLFEGNSKAAAFTAHNCDKVGYTKCDHVDCGDSNHGHQYEGICDKDGCDYNTYRLGNLDFYGGTVKTDQVITIVTQFITTDGTDSGDLKEIKRTYIQGGRAIPNGPSSLDGIAGDSLTDAFCGANKYKFKGTRAKNNPKGDFDQFGQKGGVGKIGQALDHGMVVAISLWDDPGNDMRWLDSVAPRKHSEIIGAKRGPCAPDESSKHHRRMHQLAYAKFENFMYGHIGSTIKAKTGGARLRRRFDQRRVRTGVVAKEQRRPIAAVVAAAVASLALLALLPVVWARSRSRRARGPMTVEHTREFDSGDETAAPLAPAGAGAEQ